MKILIIGSKGFIGSHLVRYFDKQHEVWQCDVVTDYTTPRYMQIDASNSDFNAVFETQQYDVCVNCSGAASVPDSFMHPYRDFLLNTANVYALLNAIHMHCPACKFINLSSAAVYGNPQMLPVVETTPIAPMSPYGRHKAMAEAICKEFAEEFGVPTCSLRIFSAFGNGLRKQIFWDMNRKMTDTVEAMFFGTGDETRDFIHIQDIAQVVDLVIKNAEFKGEAINVANGEAITIRDAVNVFAKLKGYNGQIKFNGSVREGDPRFWEADIRIIKEWGYKQTVTLEQGLKEYIIWAEKE
jgi:dTDP-glucose 4,6-dehydratase/UDP-glucose 4-epimerase